MIGLDDLNKMTSSELRAAWKQDFGRPPPARAGDVYMRSVLSYRMQEKIGPALSTSIKRYLEKVARNGKEIESSPVSRLVEGAVLLREWNGETHQVRVLDKGFEYRDHHYTNLSAIAREITDTRWSGPVFFGLKARGAKDAA
jgi:hypothetical protein